MDNETFNFFEMGILDAPPEKVEEKETSKQNSNSQKGKNTKKQVNIPQTSSSSKIVLERYFMKFFHLKRYLILYI